MTQYRAQTFAAHAPDGRVHYIDVMVEVLFVDERTNCFAKYETGLRELRRTLDGSPVNRLERGRYQIVSTGELLESADPLAP
jgi:hypothetical protein